VSSPTALVTAASVDENNHYPAISPDGSTVIFDRATGTTLPTHDSDSNPNARLCAVPAAVARAAHCAGCAFACFLASLAFRFECFWVLRADFLALRTCLWTVEARAWGDAFGAASAGALTAAVPARMATRESERTSVRSMG
jgi:hypothetical protein